MGRCRRADATKTGGFNLFPGALDRRAREPMEAEPGRWPRTPLAASERFDGRALGCAGRTARSEADARPPIRRCVTRVRVPATARWIAKGESVTISKRAFGYVAFSLFLAAPALAQTRHGEPPGPTDALPLEV